MADQIRVYDMIVCVLGVKRIGLVENTRVGHTQVQGYATKVLKRVATWCAKEGVDADLSRAHWFIDYDVNYMVDRVIVRAPLVGQQGPPGVPVGASLGGIFNEQMRAVIVRG